LKVYDIATTERKKYIYLVGHFCILHFAFFTAGYILQNQEESQKNGTEKSKIFLELYIQELLINKKLRKTNLVLFC